MLEDLAREYKQQHVDEEEVKALGINYEHGTRLHMLLRAWHEL